MEKITREELLKWLREEDDLALAVNNCWSELQDYSPAEIDEMLTSVGYEPLGKMLGGETLVMRLRHRFQEKNHNWWLTTAEAMTAYECGAWQYGDLADYIKNGLGYTDVADFLEAEEDYPEDWKALNISEDEPFYEVNLRQGWTDLVKEEPNELDILREAAEEGGDYSAGVYIAEEGEWFFDFIKRAVLGSLKCGPAEIVELMGPNTFRSHANDEDEDDE